MNISELYNIVRKLEERVTKLESENYKLKNQKKSIQDFSNIEEPILLFDVWCIDLLEKIPNYLEHVFNDNLITGIEKLLNDNIENSPIFCHNKQIFIYQKNNNTINWNKLLNDDLKKFILNIVQHFAKYFHSQWFMVNQHNIQTNDHYQDMYIDYYQKILGGHHYNSNTFCLKIQKYLYTIAKNNKDSTI
tara:strand:- start:2734 stop:3303 length:570 start_codon:yes stop_codon:yes gene_type:complete